MSQPLRPLCFVLMPFGLKTDASGATIDFDAVYRDAIAPSIETAGLEALRADEEGSGGVIHKAMFERLVLCEYAVADLTTANPNVLYELGVRHAVRPYTTLLLFAQGGRLPFDVQDMRAIPYDIDREGRLVNPTSLREAITRQLLAARERRQDSPVYQLVDAMAPPLLDHQKTDLFRERVRYSEAQKGSLAQARAAGVEALRAFERELEPVSEAEAGIVVDLFLSYRSRKAWKDMIDLVERMCPPLAASVMVREQLALALNRDNQRARAEKVLLALLTARGPSSETYGILGRVHKDMWQDAVKAGAPSLQRRGLLDQAIETYLRGFQTDWRDSYPGINAVTLMEVRDPPDPRRLEILPLVRYAVERKVASEKVDYWDWATLVELSFLQRDRERAERDLSRALAAVRETWEPETTANNLRMICEARQALGTLEPWMTEVVEALAGWQPLRGT